MKPYTAFVGVPSTADIGVRTPWNALKMNPDPSTR